MTIFGLCGQPASGKDTAADFFIAKGFVHISTGDLLRAEMRKAGIPVDRAHMSEFAAKAKKERGYGYLAELAVASIKEGGSTSDKAIVSGLRAGLEIDMLRKSFGADFRLLAVDAPLQTRYERAKKRNRPGDDIPFETFKALEERERASSTGAQEVDKVISMADVVIDNSGSIEDMRSQLAALLSP